MIKFLPVITVIHKVVISTDLRQNYHQKLLPAEYTPTSVVKEKSEIEMDHIIILVKLI